MFDSPWHWAVVAIVAFVLFFGWKQLPEMSRSVGRSLRIFKTEMKGMTDDDEARDSAKAGGAAEAESRSSEPVAPKALPKAEVVRPAASPRPRPRPQAAQRDSAGTR